MKILNIVLRKGMHIQIDEAHLTLCYLGWVDRSPHLKHCKRYTLYIQLERASCAPVELRFECTMRGTQLLAVDGRKDLRLVFPGSGTTEVTLVLVTASPTQLEFKDMCLQCALSL